MAHRYVRTSTILESAIRVPPFFIVDEILKSSFVFPVNLDLVKNSSDLAATQIADGGSIITANGISFMPDLVGFLMILICCLITLLTVILNKKELITIYLYFVSLFMLYFSYQRNVVFLNYLIVTDTHIETHPRDTAAFYLIGTALVQVLLIQSCLGFAYQYLNPVVLKNNWLSKIVLLGFLSPSILALIPFSRWFLEIVQFHSLLLLVSVSTYIFWSNVVTMSESIVEGWKFCRSVIAGFGLPALNLVLVKWSKLHLTAALRIFWITRLFYHVINYVVEIDFSKHEMESLRLDGITSWSKNIAIVLSISFQMVKSLLNSGCETLVAIAGMASCLSYIFQQISYLFQNVLLVEQRRKYFGLISGPIFCILAVQTGLTNLVPEKRIIWLTRIFLLIFSLMLYMIHRILNPMMVSLSSLHNFELHRHIRALLVSAFLILYPAGLVVYFWKNNSISTWLLGVSAFNLKIIVKMITSLTIYFVFIVDFYRRTFWEKLDDYVYYIDSFGSTIEFCVGIFLFLNGGWILVYESVGLIRAVAMCFYAYFNIWSVAKAGWSSFVRRRTAVKKIDLLQDAKTSELDDFKDVCAICYHSMKAAKITSCQHFFHAICLRKWLYLQDHCPICHRKFCLDEKV